MSEAVLPGNAGGWLCQHLWTHYAYTQDKIFLRETAWPLLSGQALFYLDWLVELPWRRSSREGIDIARSKSILDRDHYGLDEVKDRIVEYLAVQKRVRKVKGPVLCLVGPPGVGKTLFLTRRTTVIHAIFSDVHANLEALAAVLADESRGRTVLPGYRARSGQIELARRVARSDMPVLIEGASPPTMVLSPKRIKARLSTEPCGLWQETHRPRSAGL